MNLSTLPANVDFRILGCSFAAVALVLSACASPLPRAAVEAPQSAEGLRTLPPLAPEPATIVAAASSNASKAVAQPAPEPESPDGENIRFAIGSTELGAGEVERLKQVAGELRRDQTLKVLLVGFTDHLGSREYSVALASDRVKVIANKLVALGAKPKQLKRQIRGYDTSSTKRCGTDQCRRTLRRVDIRLLAAGQY